MSEFGATQSVPLLDQITGFADQFGLGWSYWDWKSYDDPTGSSHEALASAVGRLEPTAQVLSRPYAQAIAGTPISTGFDADDNSFQLVYAPSDRVKAPTIVFLDGTRQYPYGYCVSVVGGHIISPPGATRILLDSDARSTRISVAVHAGHCSSTSD
jgi:endoglycosylceramidase